MALLNLAYFGIEFAVAVRIGSVSLFADSIDFLEDAAVNLLIVLALQWRAIYRARLGMLLALILLIPTITTLWKAWEKYLHPLPPQAIPLTLTGLGALAVNFVCALMLSQYREHQGSLTKAAFLSARNDVYANIAIIAAGLLTIYTDSFWPDLIIGLCIAAMNMDAAREVFNAARAEHKAARP